MYSKVWKRRNVRFYLSKGASVDEYDQFDLTPLFVAVSYGDSELVSYLIERRADVKKETGAGYAPLHAAIITGQVDVCKLLIQHGATFWTKIHEATFYGQLDKVKELYPSVDTTENIWHKAPCIFYAIGGGHMEIVKWLVEHNPHSSVWRNLYGNTPLMCTTWSGNRTIARYLITETAATATERSDSKMTPLLWAALHGNVDMVEFLLENGSSLQELQDDGSTALLWAAKNGHVELLEWLLNHGCSLSEKTKNGSTPLICAAREGEVQMVACLLKHRANLDETNDSNETALSIAVSSEGYLDLVRYLLENGSYSSEIIVQELEKSKDAEVKLCLQYHLTWPTLRYVFIGHTDTGSPLSELPKEIIVLIGKCFV